MFCLAVSSHLDRGWFYIPENNIVTSIIIFLMTALMILVILAILVETHDINRDLEN